MRHFHRLAYLAAAAMAVAAIGCGGGDDDPPMTQVPVSGGSPTGTDKTRPEPAPKGGGESREADPSTDEADSVSGFRVVREPTEEQLAVEPGADNSLQTFGKEAEGVDLTEVLEAIRAYFQALRSGEYEKACPYISAPFAKQLRGFSEGGLRQTGQAPLEGCAAVADGISTISKRGVTRSEAEAVLTANVLRVGYEDDEIRNTAIMIFRHRSGSSLYSFAMRREDGRWKAIVLVPTPWPHS